MTDENTNEVKVESSDPAQDREAAAPQEEASEVEAATQEESTESVEVAQEETAEAAPAELAAPAAPSALGMALQAAQAEASSEEEPAAPTEPEAPTEQEALSGSGTPTEQETLSGSETPTEPEEEKILKELPPERANLPWYVVHTYSGFEQMVKASLEERIRVEKLEDKFGNILVPQETVVELVRGQKKTSTRKFLPGYIVVQMKLDDQTWHFVSETPKVTGFVGDSQEPMPLTKKEVENLVQQIEGGGQRPKPKVSFEEGDSIKVIDGPFADFNGTVDEVKPDKGKLRVLISIFGRNTPVELDFVQVEKA